MSFVNFNFCSIALVMCLLNDVHLSNFVVIRDYCTQLSLDGFPNATTLLSLSFEQNNLSIKIGGPTIGSFKIQTFQTFKLNTLNFQNR